MGSKSPKNEAIALRVREGQRRDKQKYYDQGMHAALDSHLWPIDTYCPLRWQSNLPRKVVRPLSVEIPHLIVRRIVSQKAFYLSAWYQHLSGQSLAS